MGVERKRDKSVKGEVGEEPKGESAVGSGMEKYLSSFLPQGVGKQMLCSECLYLERRC